MTTPTVTTVSPSMIVWDTPNCVDCILTDWPVIKAYCPAEISGSVECLLIPIVFTPTELIL